MLTIASSLAAAAAADTIARDGCGEGEEEEDGEDGVERELVDAVVVLLLCSISRGRRLGEEEEDCFDVDKESVVASPSAADDLGGDDFESGDDCLNSCSICCLACSNAIFLSSSRKICFRFRNFSSSCFSIARLSCSSSVLSFWCRFLSWSKICILFTRTSSSSN